MNTTQGKEMSESRTPGPLVCWCLDGTLKRVPVPTNEQMVLNELVNLVNACEAHGLFITGPARAAIAKAAA